MFKDLGYCIFIFIFHSWDAVNCSMAIQRFFFTGFSFGKALASNFFHWIIITGAFTVQLWIGRCQRWRIQRHVFWQSLNDVMAGFDGICGSEESWGWFVCGFGMGIRDSGSIDLLQKGRFAGVSLRGFLISG